MKRYLFVAFLCLFCIHGMAEYYYYYHGKKQPLVINSDSVVIYTKSDTRVKSVDQEFVPYTIKRERVSRYQMDDNMVISSIEYIVGDKTTRKMSNCFYVKLYQYADTAILNDIVEETQTHLVGEVPYMDKWYKIMVSNSVVNNSLEMSNYFYETGAFADIDPGFVFEFTPNCVTDTYFPTQWEYNAINACNAWSKTTGNANIRVAVIDQGIDKTHTEFVGTTFTDLSYDCQTNKTGAELRGSHGTTVAGIIAANHNHGLVAGIAPKVSLMPVSHSLSISPHMSEELASGISWAVQHGADVINCSWGDQGGQHYETMHSAILEDALINALYNGRNGKGCIVVFASGNQAGQGLPIDYPAYFTPEILVTGSIGTGANTYGRSFFSAYGASLDIMAPGQNLRIIEPNNTYNLGDGTSFAAPYVSGIAALVLSINPDLSREAVVNILETTAQKVGNYTYSTTTTHSNGIWNEEMGYGVVDAYAAVLAARTKYIQNQTYHSRIKANEYAAEIIAGYAVTNDKSYGNVTLEAGSDVILRAAKQVVLKSGFYAKAGSKLHIKADAQTIASQTYYCSPQARRKPTLNATDGANTMEDIASPNCTENIGNNKILFTIIYTVSGQLLQTIYGADADFSSLPNGFYVLQKHLSDGRIVSETITNVTP